MRRVVIIGEDHLWIWGPPSGGAVIDPVDPRTLTISWPWGSQSYELSLIRPSDRVTAVSADRRRLTVAWGSELVPGGAPSALSQVPEPAVLVDGARAQMPVTVSRVEDLGEGVGTVHLAEALPMPLTPGAAELHWPTRAATIPAADVGTSRVRQVMWRVDYSPSVDGSIRPLRSEVGTLAVARMRFDTGLTDAQVATEWPSLGQPPAGQAGWERMRLAALTTLESRIITAGILRDAGIDDVHGAQLVRLHSLLTVQQILTDRHIGGRDQGPALQLVAGMIDAEQNSAFGSLAWVDVNGDGLPNAGEANASTYVQATSAGTFPRRPGERRCIDIWGAR